MKKPAGDQKTTRLHIAGMDCPDEINVLKQVLDSRGGARGAALEAADIALMTDDLRKLPWLLRHSRRTKAIIIQNITLSLGIKAIFMLLAIPGLANLWMAIAAVMGALLLVTFNGLRLLRLSISTVHARGHCRGRPEI